MQHCNAQFLYALLILLAFICTITIANFFKYNSKRQFIVFTIALITIKKIFKYLPLNALWGLTTFYVLLQLTTFVCTITIDNFCMDYCNKGLSHTTEQH